MTRCLVTFAVGVQHEELLEIALPSFERYAALHGYELVVAEPDPCDRPPSWWKIPALRSALSRYDEAVWVDADIVVTNPSRRVPCPRGAWQAMVEHHTPDGDVPNLGVWLLRRPMLPVLDEMWARDEYIGHGWWEQAAMLDLLGYRHDIRPCRLETPTSLYERTSFLDAGWNVHCRDSVESPQPRFMHATMHDDRVAAMRSWAEGAYACAS